MFNYISFSCVYRDLYCIEIKVVAAGLIYMAENAMSSLESEHPDYNCPNFDITPEMVYRN